MPYFTVKQPDFEQKWRNVCQTRATSLENYNKYGKIWKFRKLQE